MTKLIKIIVLITTATLQLNAQTVTITEQKAKIENDKVAIEFDLAARTYSGLDKFDNTVIFKDALFLLDRGQRMWKEPKQRIRAEEIMIDEGKQLRVWYISEEGYDPHRFLNVILRDDNSFVGLG